MSMKTPLGEVLGTGSARSGSGHWWAQRLTSVAMVPLTLWFAWSLLSLPGLADYPVVHAWMSRPVSGIMLTLLLLTVLYHSSLGLQVIVEDYVHHAVLKVTTLVTLKFLHVMLAVAGVYSIFRIAVGVNT